MDSKEPSGSRRARPSLFLLPLHCSCCTPQPQIHEQGAVGENCALSWHGSCRLLAAGTAGCSLPQSSACATDVRREFIISILAIKDIVWSKKESGWAYNVAPAGTGIVKWTDAGKGVADVGFQGTIVLHGEYEAPDISERTTLAVEELRFLKKVFG